jgi:hypothetical protein
VRIVRGRADARWLPSRHNSALFRLLAYMRLRRSKPEHRDVILVIDRHQSATETWIVTSWITLTFACYLAAFVFAEWHVAFALAVSVPLAIMLLEVPAILSALVIAPLWNAIRRNRGDLIRVNAFVLMVMFSGVSAYAATQRTWVRFVGWQFLAVLVLDGIAAVIVFTLRDSIATLEAKVGGASSGR